MMNVRKYRAATTRDALELVKKDLGEDAFVLETKKVRTGGFLGVRTRTEVEVSAATSDAISGKEKTGNHDAEAASDRILDLKDEAAATPDFSSFIPKAKNADVTAAIANRAAAAAEYEGRTSAARPAVKAAADTVEISSEAPRFVFPKNTDQKPIASGRPLRSTPAADPAAGGLTERHLDALRAELREVKFSLGALASLQHSTLQRTGSIDLGVFGESIDPQMNDIFLELLSTGLSAELAKQFVRDFTTADAELPVDPAHFAKAVLLNALPFSIDFQPEILKGDGGVTMAIVGSTGVGKTTTAAKLAARAALHDHHRVELVTLDTYRIAAVEQLKTYAEIIGAGCHVVRTVLELEAVLSRLPKDAKILIDTTGRNPHDLSDQYELSDFLKRRPQVRKCLVVQATTHPIDASAAIRKFQMYGSDCLAVTKMDETTRPGALVETIIESGLPLAYLGNGQRVPEDIHIATAETLSNSVLAARI